VISEPVRGARHRHWRIIDNARAAGDVGKGYLGHETITFRQKRRVFGLIKRKPRRRSATTTSGERPTGSPSKRHPHRRR
jgi:hypothetical protein